MNQQRRQTLKRHQTIITLACLVIAACKVAFAETPDRGRLPALQATPAPAARSDPSADSRSQSRSDAVTAHWAFRPLRVQSPPPVRDTSWVQTPIDRFVLARLESANLQPAPPADRRTLLRRVTYDLIGLPPPFEDIESFVADSMPNAFGRAVDRLLESPEFGQRWARYWLDVARYADTTGYIEGGEVKYPFAYTYRDYVVRSLNEDTPFDRFVVEQLAADQLEFTEDERWKLAAMGFLTLGPRFNYNRHEIIDDRIDVMTRGLLGLSVACARCHDHKYDPVPTDDYYSLYGVLASSVEPLCTDLPRIGEAGGSFAEYRQFREAIAKRTQVLEQFHQATHRKIQHEMRSIAGEYLWYVVQLMPEHRTQTQFSYETKRGLIRGPTPYGPGGVVRWQHYITTRGDDDAVFGLWNRLARSPRDQFNEQVSRSLAELPSANARLRDAVQQKLPASMVELAGVYGDLLERTYADWQALLARDAAATTLPDSAAEELRQVLFAADSPVAMNEYEAHDCYTDGEFNRYMSLKRELDATFVKFLPVAAPRAMVMVDRREPYAARVFERGNATRPGRAVARQMLAVFSNAGDRTFTNGSGRLEFARALTETNTAASALVARVYVNRVWMHLFGNGLVRTPSDFGTRGEPPSHPDLLDYLAARFIQDGWSTKKLIRLILQSSVYQQESRIVPIGTDPDHRLLSGMNRRRLDFESFRDTLLKVSGRLDTTLGGPPVTEFRTPRRSIYLLVDRNRAPAVFGTFDFPNPDISSPRRPETTVPQQALYIMNSPFMDEVVAGVVSSMQSTGNPKELSAQIRWLYRRLFGRDPTAAELRLGVAFLNPESIARTSTATESNSEPAHESRATVSRGDETPAVNPAHDAWHLYVQSLLMLNEFVYID